MANSSIIMENSNVSMDNNSVYLHNGSVTIDNTIMTMMQQVIFSSVGAFILIGNGVVFCMAVLFKELRTDNFVFYILFLSASDVLVGISTIMMAVRNITGVSNMAYCLFVQISLMTTITITSVQTLMICLQRYFAFQPNANKGPPSTRRYLYLVLNWALSFGLSVCILLPPTVLNATKCNQLDIFGDDDVLKIPRIVFGAIQLTILLVIAVVYIQIFKEIRTRMSQQRSLHKISLKAVGPTMENLPTQQLARHARMRQSFITVNILLVEYVVCFGSGSVMFIINPYVNIPTNIRFISLVMPFINSLFNPILYAWRLPKFRKYFICCRCRRQNVD